MRKKILFIAMMFCAAVSFTSCHSDDDPVEKEDWSKVLPTESVTVGDNLSVKLNGEDATSGNIKFTVDQTKDNAATVALNDILPGYAELDVPVTLTKSSDNNYAFKGTLAVTSAPQMTRMAEAGYTIYNVNVDGTLANGKYELTVSSELSEEAQGGLTGTWTLLDKATPNAEGTGYESAPLLMTWSANDAEKPNMAGVANIAVAFGNPVLYNLLQNVTFNADGNITASYYKTQDDESVMNFMGATEENEDGTYSYKVVHKGEWSQSPKNLAFWYAKDNCIYVTPNISAILGAEGVEDGSISIDDVATLASALGIDKVKLAEALNTWNKTGIPVKYTINGNNLSVYVDKELANPVIQLLLPALPTLQKMYEGMKESDPTNYQYLSMLLGMMGAKSFNDIATIWNENTKDFGISLNFKK